MAALKDWISFSDTRNGSVVVWSAVLVMVCLLGDQICSMATQSPLLWRALADSVTHGTVGVMSWAVVVLPGLSVDRWGMCILCGLLAAIIDVDHFWQAGSLELKAAVSLQHRPPLHSTSLVVLLSALLWAISLVFRLWVLRKAALMCLTAWLSHHLRDASRRGLWFPPFGSTPPLPYALYIASIVILSVMVHYGYSHFCHAVPVPERVIHVAPKVVVH